MATYDALREKYRKRQRDAWIDTISVGLSCADEMMVDLGLLEQIGGAAEMLNSLFGALPFVFIVATEGTQVILGKKGGVSAAKNVAFRAVKSSAAMAVGTGVAMAAGGLAAMPAAVAVHLLFERHKSKALLGRRLEKRTETVHFLAQKWSSEPERAALPHA